MARGRHVAVFGAATAPTTPHRSLDRSTGPRCASTTPGCSSPRPAPSRRSTLSRRPRRGPRPRLIGQCCRAFLASFKIWNMATVGGNLCMALPAGPMISLCAALDGVCVIWTPEGGERRLSDLRFRPRPAAQRPARGRALRGIELPRAALTRRTAFRRASLDAARAFRRPADRRARRGRRIHSDRHRLDPTAGAARLRLRPANRTSWPSGSHAEIPPSLYLRRHPRPAGLAPAHDVRIRRGNPRANSAEARR